MARQLASTCTGYLLIRQVLRGETVSSCFFSLVNVWEQHDEEISILASSAYQKLDKTCHASLNH